MEQSLSSGWLDKEAYRYGSAHFTYPSTPYFSDVPAINPFFPFIQKMAQMGITAGCGNGLYCPDETLTRGQMAVFIVTGLLNQLVPEGTVRRRARLTLRGQ